MSETKEKPTGLALLRVPFPEHQISKLPKPTKAQTEEVKADYKKGIRCEVCGAWHHPKVVHLDYVGHAALTDRLLDVDPEWSWEPVAFGPDGQPAVDREGGMWIKLTVCGVTRYGYGDAGDKTGPNAVKERIGDALRNAAMRFGAALDLWHKGDLHGEDDEPADPGKAAAAAIANAKITPAGGTREQLAPEQLKRVEDCASEVIDMFEGGLPPEESLKLIDTFNFDADEKAALTTYLDSKMRTALRKAREAQAKSKLKELEHTQP